MMYSVRMIRCCPRAILRTSSTARTSGLFIDTPSNFSSVPLDDKYTLVKIAVHAFRGMFQQDRRKAANISQST